MTVSPPKGLEPLHSSRFPSFQLALAAFLLLPAIGCHGQAAANGAALSAQQDRNVQLEIRSQLGVPPNWIIAPGARESSNIPGYDKLNIEFYPEGQPDQKQPIAFFISKDGKTLARLSTYDLADIPGTHIDTAGRPVRGAKDAKVELVNFDDLECPFCARMYAELFPDTLDHYKGLIKIVYKDDPLTEIHPWAMRAAVDANCVAAQSGDAYWNYVNYLHTHGEDITGPDRDVKKSYAMLDQLAKDEGTRDKLNLTTLDNCLAKQDETLVRSEMKEADTLKIQGTPALFVDGERIDGAQPTPYIWAAIDRALKAKGITPPADNATTPTTDKAAQAAADGKS
jgi:protein-disulfide isomerase